MKKQKKIVSKLVVSTVLVSFLGTSTVQAFETPKLVTELFNLAKIGYVKLKVALLPDRYDQIMRSLSHEQQSQLKEMVGIWLSAHIIAPVLSPLQKQVGLYRNEKGELTIMDVSQKKLTISERTILSLLGRLNKSGELVPFVDKLLEVMRKENIYTEVVSKITPEKKELIYTLMTQTLDSTTSIMDFSKQTWSELSDDLEQRVKNTPKLSDSDFTRDLAKSANSHFSKVNNVKLLVDGNRSFPVRDSLTVNAKNTINMITWAVLDDFTGTELADQLIAQKNKGVKVRLIVDGKVSLRKGYSIQVQRMLDAGIELIRWNNPNALFMGQHRKVLIVDDESVVAGGLNPGDTYSHKAGTDLWRDTDVYFDGPVVLQEQIQFAKIWNSQIDLQKLKYNKIQSYKVMKPNAPILEDVDGTAMVIDHEPSKVGQDQHEITVTLMKAIRAAESSIDIENAYVIAFPSLISELKFALSRGVKVRMLTNSTKSVDEEIVSVPILRTAVQIADLEVNGNKAEVYLKKGHTLHSKFMTVDKKFFIIGSYNIHPRSERVEGETIVVFNDKELTRQATEAFENDISPENATRLGYKEDPEIKISGSTVLPLRMFFDQL